MSSCCSRRAQHFCDIPEGIDDETSIDEHFRTRCGVDSANGLKRTTYEYNQLPRSTHVCYPVLASMQQTENGQQGKVTPWEYSIDGLSLDMESATVGTPQLWNDNMAACNTCPETYMEETSSQSDYSGFFAGCAKYCWTFTISGEKRPDGCAFVGGSGSHARTKPMQYIAYNPTIPASRAWTCGFAEAFR